MEWRATMNRGGPMSKNFTHRGSRRLVRIGAMSLCLAVAAATGARGADLSATPDFGIADPAPAGGWEMSFTPYGWFVGLAGDATIRGNKLDISASFIEIVEQSDWLIPAMGYFEVSNGRLSLFTDVFYTETRFSKSNSLDISKIRTRRGRKVGETDLTLDGKAGMTQTLAFAEAGVAYEIARIDDGPMGTTAVDVLAGARYWYNEADLSLRVKGEVDFTRLNFKKKGKFATATTKVVDWVDPVVGARVEQEFAPGRKIQFIGDIGGFGIGSELTWQVFAGYSREFHTGRTTLSYLLGYRAVGFDYEGKDGNNFNLVLHGPITGLTMRW